MLIIYRIAFGTHFILEDQMTIDDFIISSESVQVFANELPSDVQCVVLVNSHGFVQTCQGCWVVFSKLYGLITVHCIEEDDIAHRQGGGIVLELRGKVKRTSRNHCPAADHVFQFGIFRGRTNIGPTELFRWTIHLNENIGVAIPTIVHTECVILDVTPSVQRDVFHGAAESLNYRVSG